MDHSSDILIVSRDPMLLQTRRLILGTYFQVESAGRVSEAGMLLTQQSFHLILLCDTLSDAECLQIAEMVRNRYPRPTLLSMMSPGQGRRDAVVGRMLPCGGGPLALLRECAAVLGCDIRGKQRMVAA